MLARNIGLRQLNIGTSGTAQQIIAVVKGNGTRFSLTFDFNLELK